MAAPRAARCWRIWLPEAAREPRDDTYARHLLHKDQHNRFVVLALVWNPGQGTPIHDHACWGLMGILENSLREVDYERLDHLTRATISDAAEAGIPVVFFRVPAYLEAPVDPAFADEFRARYGAELLIPPVELLEQLYVREFYQNVGHVGPEGREIFSTWLGEAIARVLVEDS